MIAMLKGQLVLPGGNRVVLDVNGVGYDLVVPESVFAELPAAGSTATLFVHTHVREDEITLFGFVRPSDRDLFRRLIRLHGIGPKIALAVLTHLPGPALAGAVAQGRIAALTRVPGVGRKTAERIVLELKDKLAELEGLTAGSPGAVPGGEPDDELLRALKNLGFKTAVCERAVAEVRRQAGPSAPFEDLLRLALSLIE